MVTHSVVLSCTQNDLAEYERISCFSLYWLYWLAIINDSSPFSVYSQQHVEQRDWRVCDMTRMRQSLSGSLFVCVCVYCVYMSVNIRVHVCVTNRARERERESASICSCSLKNSVSNSGRRGGFWEWVFITVKSQAASLQLHTVLNFRPFISCQLWFSSGIKVTV